MELPATDVIKMGFLKFKGKMIWQRQWAVLKKSSSKGGMRIERYSDEKLSHKKNDNSINLSGVLHIKRVMGDKKFMLSIAFTDTSQSLRVFSCESEGDLCAWNMALNKLCLGQDMGSMQGVSSIDLLQCGPSQKELTETFNVYLLRSLNLAFYGECMLQVTQECIHLLECSNPSKRLVTWALNALRRYGSDGNKFSFESGRNCDTGEGIFIVTTQDGQAIHDKVHVATIAIADMNQRIRRQNLNHSTSLPGPAVVIPASAPYRSISSPGPGLLPPELPPPRNEQDSPHGMKLQAQFTTSVLNSPLPDIPPPMSMGQYLLGQRTVTTINEDTDVPLENAPPPPPPNASPLSQTAPVSSSKQSKYLSMNDIRMADEYISLSDRLKRNDSRMYMVIDQDRPADVTKPRNNGALGARQTDGAQGGEPIYEEKDLSDAFRTFLRMRKDDEVRHNLPSDT